MSKSTTPDIDIFPTGEQADRLAGALWQLLVPPGIEKARAQRWNFARGNPGRGDYSRSVGPEDLRLHVRGDQRYHYRRYIFLRTVHHGLATWIALDVDGENGEFPVSRVAELAAWLRTRSYPFLVHFSGQKGVHFIIPFSNPVAETRQLGILKTINRGTRHLVDKYAYGRVFISTPCGRHPVSGRRNGFIDPDTLQPLGIDREIALLQNCDKLTVHSTLAPVVLPVRDQTPALQPTFEPIQFPSTLTPIPRIHKFKECLNKLWSHGLYKPHSRHDATCAIIAAIKTHKDIPIRDRWAYVKNWIDRTFPNWIGNLAATSTYESCIEQANRIMFGKDGHYITTDYEPDCYYSFFAKGMRTACTPEDELRCMQCYNLRLEALEEVLDQCIDNLPIWGKIGWAKLQIYRNLWRLALKSDLTYQGMSVVRSTHKEIAGPNGPKRKTVAAALKKFREYELALEVPAGAFEERRTGRGRAIGCIAMPQLSEALLRGVISRCRGGTPVEGLEAATEHAAA